MSNDIIAIARKAIYENIRFYAERGELKKVALLKDQLRKLEKSNDKPYFREADNEYPY